MLFACRIAAPARRDGAKSMSIVSPCATTMAVPPSQLQFCAGGCGLARRDERRDRAGIFGTLPAADSCRCRRRRHRSRSAASAEVSTLCVGAACWRTEPVTSLELGGCAAACGLRRPRTLAQSGRNRCCSRQGRRQAPPAGQDATRRASGTARRNSDMGTLTHTQRLTSELNTDPVNRALSLTASQP